MQFALREVLLHSIRPSSDTKERKDPDGEYSECWYGNRDRIKICFPLMILICEGAFFVI
jgi:hypothetical protein